MAHEVGGHRLLGAALARGFSLVLCFFLFFFFFFFFFFLLLFGGSAGKLLRLESLPLPACRNFIFLFF